jgi:hypothetical protein
MISLLHLYELLGVETLTFHLSPEPLDIQSVLNKERKDGKQNNNKNTRRKEENFFLSSTKEFTVRPP